MTETPTEGKHAKKTPGVMPSNIYDVLRFCALILFPSIGTAYFGLAQIWGLPAAEEVVGSIVVIDTFLGVFVRQARTAYEKSDERFDGHIDVVPADNGNSNLNVRLDPRSIAGKDEIVVKVNKEA